MALMMLLALLLAIAGRSSANFCVCNDGISEAILQKALDYACGAGADCTPILQSGVCYNPNTVKSHCDYAVNSYFQRKGQVAGSCDFAGSASLSNVAPVQSSGCIYQSSPSTTSSSSTTTPTVTTPTTTTPTNTTTPSSNIPGTTPPVFGTGLGPSSFSNADPTASSAWSLPLNPISTLLYIPGLAFLLLKL